LAKPWAAFSSSATTNDRSHKIVVLGGGTGGLASTSQLLKHDSSLDIAIVEPSTKHYYQPGWTLVGAGELSQKSTVREEEQLIPKGAKWIKDRVIGLNPDKNQVTTEQNGNITYEYLIIATGMQLNWGNVKGLQEALGKDGVSSNYSFDYAPKTFDFIKATKSGTALFTQPSTPVKCGGAPQKITFLADDYWRKNGVRGSINVHFLTGTPTQFMSPPYAEALVKLCDEKNIKRHYKKNLIEIKADKHIAVFKNLENNTEEEIEYSFIHVTPPQSAPDCIKKSPVANEAGWVDVDPKTTQHKKFPNIFSLGDSSSLPTSKTAAAIAVQSPVVVQNLLSVMKGGKPIVKYEGYTSCPIPTAYGKLMLAEFDYTLQRKESFPSLGDSRVPRTHYYYLKKFGFPPLYWSYLLTGKWKGLKAPIPITE